MGFYPFLAVCYCLVIYLPLVAGYSSEHRRDHDCIDSPDSPENEDQPSPNPSDDDEVNLFNEDNNSMTTEPSSPSRLRGFTISDILNETRFDMDSEETSPNDGCLCYPSHHQSEQHVQLPEMSMPTFNESSYLMPEIPINRPHCPVPNTQLFMPPHVFNSEMFPPPPYENFNHIRNVTTHDAIPDLPSPNSSSMFEDQRPYYPVPDTHLQIELPHLLQTQAANPPIVQDVFDPNEPGPSHRGNVPVPGGIARVPPLTPLTVDIPRTIELTCQQMANLRAELLRVSNVFSRLATIVQRKSCAPLPGVMCPARNPFGRTTEEPSNLERPNEDVNEFGPTKAKQLKTKQAIVKTSKPKPPKAPNATQSNIGLVTIAPPTVKPVNGKSSQLTLAILKPSMLTYPGRKHAIVQTDPPKYNSFEGLFRRRSSTDTEDELDENGNIVNPKRNLKRRHSESDQADQR